MRTAADIRGGLDRMGRAVLVMVTEAHGSTPREAGAVMLVGQASAEGTIGGGTVEHRAIGIARDMLAGGRLQAEVNFPLGPAMDQCCGGHLTVAFAVLDQIADGPLELWPGGPVFRDPPEAPAVYIYGAGHVGRALVGALTPLDWQITWIDARVGMMGGAPDGVTCIETPLPEAVADAAPPQAMHLVMTHSHALDLEIVAAVLKRTHGFCGLIGSATKRATFTRRLAERGIDAARLTCPIGLPGLKDKRPAMISASVTAQLLQVQAQTVMATQEAG